MPIKQVDENLRLPVIGKIRLGERVGEKEYPKNQPYFILKDAPDVQARYGENPTEIDVMFLSDEIDEAVPYWYKWYGGGVRNAQGEVIGGKLLCKGDGETADFLAKRDPVTRIVPTRQCLCEKCPDWNDPKGRRQCKPSMNIYAFIPLASPFGVYQIDTTSWRTISRVVSQLKMIKKAYGKIRMIAFKLYKEEEATTYYENGVEKKGKQHILNIRPNHPHFFEQYKEQLIQVRGLIDNPSLTFRPTQELIEAPMEDNFAAHTPAIEHKPVADMQAIADNPELAPMFEQLCNSLGKQNNQRIRLLTAKKFENDADPSASLRAYLVEKTKQELPAPAKVPEPSKEAPQPPSNADGII